ncbi:MAG: SpaH/EbpB family LPXTG-anchored major pilin [Microbacterium sp.]|nr:SpaH/EbpB family LPXTG-anchored major pilin [Microbacterium sp.]
MADHKVRRLSALLGVAAIGLSGVLGASVAQAAEAPSYGNINPNATGSLTVHKYLHQTGGAVGDPTGATTGTFTNPVADVVFTVYPLKKSDGSALDLSVPANWDGLATATPGAGCTAPAGYTLGAGIAMPKTDATGLATLPLKVGAYQVCETAAPANIVDRSAPFIVTIPMPNKNQWIYDVNAFPKNGAGQIEKKIDPQLNTGLGSVVTFPVTAPVPTSSDPWTGFAIRDTLDARLTPVTAAATKVTVDGVALDPTFYTIAVAGQQVTMNFTPAGLAWLNQGPNAQAGKKITVAFAGTITSVGNGTINNTAQLWTNNPGFDSTVRPPLPSNEVKTNWGSLDVLKRAAGSTGSEGLLQGATFEVYNATAPYAADCSTATATGAPISVNGKTSFTSDASGVISIAGLFVSDSVNPVVNATKRCYVLKETAAPAGYVLPANPNTGIAVKAGQTTTADNPEIVNTKQGVPSLPMTGANGQIVLITAGVAAVAVAFGLVLMKRRREAAHTE